MDFFTEATDGITPENDVLLFEVHAEHNPNEALQHIGNIKLTSPLATSAFGDERLFFQHETMNRDLIKLKKQDSDKDENRKKLWQDMLERTVKRAETKSWLSKLNLTR